MKKNYRIPVVAVMGHVDHGKTSLLDVIRGTSVQEGEAGGITQNTRSHKVTLKERFPKIESNLSAITFIDTPGHEAFTEMRSRGARVADIVILVVAADDGVQPQTEESIKFIKENNLPVIIAANKTDLPGANIDKLKQQLSTAGILVEDYGGESILVPVSAKKEKGIQELLETISLVSEVNELFEYEPTQGEAEAFVLESNLDTDLGAVALAIIKSGEINKNQYIIEGENLHKIRATLNESQQQTEKNIQGDPVWIIGIDHVMNVGQNLLFYSDKDQAEEIVTAYIEEQKKKQKVKKEEEQNDDEIFAALLQAKADRQTSETNLNVILKADTQGTLEAIADKIKTLNYDEAKITLFSTETGNISRNDVEMARDIKGIVLGFQVKLGKQAEKLARDEKILVRTYSIIYDMIDEIDGVIKSMLTPEEEIEVVATAKVKQVFELTNGSFVAGCEVTKGTVLKGYKAYVERKGEEVSDGKIISLKQNKNDVKEIKKGQECGIIMSNKFEYQEGDEIICYKVI